MMYCQYFARSTIKSISLHGSDTGMSAPGGKAEAIGTKADIIQSERYEAQPTPVDDFRFWLDSEVQPSEIEARLYPSFRHSGQGPEV